MLSIPSLGQLDATTFQDFSQSILNPYLLNPATSRENYQLKAQSNYVAETGLFKNVAQYYVDLDLHFSSKNNRQNHFIGLQATNSKQGDFIHKNKLYLRYSNKIKINQNTDLSAGLAIGIINMAFISASGTSGGSDFGPDGSIGLRLIKPQFVVGFSAQQIFPTILAPINQTFDLTKLYNLDILKEIKISANVSWEFQAQAQINHESKIAASVQSFLNFKEQYFFGFGVHPRKKLSINFGFETKIKKNPLQFFVIYNYFSSKHPPKDNSIEFYISATYNGKRKTHLLD